jgi:hypothetical protein
MSEIDQQEARYLRAILREIARTATQAVDTPYAGRILRQIEIRVRTALDEYPRTSDPFQVTGDLLRDYLESMEDERRVNSEFVASINRGSTASDDVKQEASDRLLKARQRSHALYRALHLSATGREADRYGLERGKDT